MFGFHIKADGTPNGAWFLIALSYLYFTGTVSHVVSQKAVKRAEYSKALMIGLNAMSALLWVLLCKVIHVGSWWYMSIVAFFVGVVVYNCQMGYKKRLGKHVLSALILLIMLFLASFLLAIKTDKIVFSWITSGIIGVAVYTYFIAFEFKSKIFSYLGRYSLELFLFHIKVLDVLVWMNQKMASISIILIYAVCILGAIAINKVSHIFNRHIAVGERKNR
jgi:hypothetical protein